MKYRIVYRHTKYNAQYSWLGWFWCYFKESSWGDSGEPIPFKTADDAESFIRDRVVNKHRRCQPVNVIREFKSSDGKLINLKKHLDWA